MSRVPVVDGLYPPGLFECLSDAREMLIGVLRDEPAEDPFDAPLLTPILERDPR